MIIKVGRQLFSCIKIYYTLFPCEEILSTRQIYERFLIENSFHINNICRNSLIIKIYLFSCLARYLIISIYKIFFS